MADESKEIPEKPAAAAKSSQSPEAGGEEHYEEVAEYRIGEGPPPLPLVVCMFLIVLWATISWIPFFNY